MMNLTPELSHKNSLEFLQVLESHDDFMDSITNVVDMGAGVGFDSLWWATRTAADEDGNSSDRNIKVTAIDLDIEQCLVKNKQINWLQKDFSNSGLPLDSVDILWAHNSFQYSKDPLGTLSHWYDLMKLDSMLCLSIPFNFDIWYMRDQPRINSVWQSGCYFNYTPVNLILLLASSGFDCRGGHFKYLPYEPWFHAAVYKTENKPQRMMSWYELLDKKILPISIEKAILSKGHVSDRDLIVEWIDHSTYNFSLL